MRQELSIRRGVTRQTDPERAAQDLHAALAQPDITLAVFYCAPSYDLPALAAALKAQFGTTTLIGCTTAGEITPEGYLQNALTGFSVASDDFHVAVSRISLDPFDATATEQGADRLLRDLEDEHGTPPSPGDTFGFLLVDGLAMLEERLVSVIYRHLRGIELVGGSAADSTDFVATHIYHDGAFHRNIALLTLVRTSLPFKVFHTQHFENTEQRMVVTRADPAARRVYEINGLPAAREFARLIGLDVQELTPFIFATHPVVVRVGGRYYVRSIAYVHTDGSLQFFCAIANGIVLTVAKGVDMVDNLREAFEEVRASIGPPQLVLGCDCILRRLEVDRDGLGEAISDIFIENNVIGFATYGEQYNAMHVNQTFTGVAIGRG